METVHAYAQRVAGIFHIPQHRTAEKDHPQGAVIELFPCRIFFNRGFDEEMCHGLLDLSRIAVRGDQLRMDRFVHDVIGQLAFLQLIVDPGQHLGR